MSLDREGLDGRSPRRRCLAISRLLASLWTLVPPLGFSALVHAVDPDVGGVAGLAAPGVCFSVAVIATPLVVLAWACLASMRVGGTLAAAAVLLGSSVAVALVIALAGSTADTILEHLVSFAGLTAAVAACLLAAVLPRAVLAPTAAE